MNKIILPIFSISLTISGISMANELHTQTWNFPTPDESIVASGKIHSFCSANPDKCPAGLFSGFSEGKGKGGSGTPLFNPSTSSSANQSTLTVVGNGNTVTLTTTQSSEDDRINANSENTAEIDYNEVLNYSN